MITPLSGLDPGRFEVPAILKPLVAQFVHDELRVSRITATRYLDALAAGGILDKVRVGRNNFYVNTRVVGIPTDPPSRVYRHPEQ